MKVLMIEDERQSLEGLKRIAEGVDDRIERIFFCDHAAAALEVIEEHRPELIVTDIILPDMTGLDLLEHAQIIGYKPKILIVSGFDDFEYAKRGLKLGAIDYFLKPFDTSLFRAKLKECLDLTQAEREEKRSAERMVHLGTRAMRDSFLLGACLRPTFLEEHVVHRLRTWGLEWMAYGSYTVLAIAAKAFVEELPEEEEEILSFATGNIVDELLAAFSPSVTFKNSKKYWIVATPLEELKPLLDTLRQGLGTYQKAVVSIGVSERTGSFQALHQAYAQAMDSLRAALLSKDRNVYTYERFKAEAPERIEDLAANAAESIECGNEQAIRGTAERFVRGVVANERAARPIDLAQRCLDWVMEVHALLRRRSERSVGDIPVSLWEELDHCATSDDLSDALARYFLELALQFKGQNKHSIVEQALKLIRAKYAEDVKLQTVADELAIHPVWLSQLFKRETGSNFLDYVTDLRIRKAQELLRQSNMKIYEIAGAVGYQDLHYFGRLFKRKTGSTPKEYRYGR